MDFNGFIETKTYIIISFNNGCRLDNRMSIQVAICYFCKTSFNPRTVANKGGHKFIWMQHGLDMCCQVFLYVIDKWTNMLHSKLCPFIMVYIEERVTNRLIVMLNPSIIMLPNLGIILFSQTFCRCQ